jgi:hypothetical protein
VAPCPGDAIVTAARAPWSLWAISLALTAGGVAFLALNRFDLEQLAAEGAYLNDLLVALTFPVVGALITSRRPDNVIGWIFSATGLVVGAILFAGTYGIYGTETDPGSLPGSDLMLWFEAWAWIPVFSTIATFLLLLFPTGRLLSQRWRPLAWVTAGGIVVATLSLALHPEPVEEGVENPVGIAGADTVLLVIGLVGGAAVIAGMLAGVFALYRRLRCSAGEERQQLKWFTYAAAVFAVLVLGSINVESNVLLGIAQAIAVGPGLALAVGIAILRYRLYDIDVVINRTLVYGSLTALLAGTYFGLVLLFQLALGPLTEGNELAVAVSTLAVAALFRPVRRRIQELVDRRFYRRKYDAERTLAGFALRLREEVDLRALRAELTGVVAEAMQPAHVSLWLPENETSRNAPRHDHETITG